MYMCVLLLHSIVIHISYIQGKGDIVDERKNLNKLPKFISAGKLHGKLGVFDTVWASCLVPHFTTTHVPTVLLQSS